MSALLEPRSDKHPALPIGQFFHDPHPAPHPVLILKLFFRTGAFVRRRQETISGHGCVRWLRQGGRDRLSSSPLR